MFGRLFVYNIKRQLRSKELVFWNLCFPIILGTLFAMTFGDVMETEELLHTIPVAYVAEEGTEDEFRTVLQTLETSEEELIAVTETEWEEGTQLLSEEEVDGIFYHTKDGITLYVEDSGINQSVLEMIVEQYQQQKSLITDIAATHPEKLTEIMEGMDDEISILYEEKYTDGSMDALNSYFYALIAMSCLYGCFGGVVCAVDHKANLSSLAARRVVASTNRFMVMVADVLSHVLEVTVYTMFSVLYLKYAMQVDFANKLLPMLLVVFLGSFIGVATGFFIGSIGHMKPDTKQGMAVAVTMLECFMSGLMVDNMYHIIQDICPLLNKINPASLIVDAIYSLDIYSDYSRFCQNLGILGIFAAVLCVASYLMVRRERYASI